MSNGNLIWKALVIAGLWILAPSRPAAQDLTGPDREAFDRGMFHFEKKEYQVGLSYFRELISKYPRDPVFNYFSGVSMTELQIDLETAIRQLQLASVKKVPRNVYFYLAKACHLLNHYDEALDYYSRFLEFGEKSEIRSLQVEHWMAVCRDHRIPDQWKRDLQAENAVDAGRNAEDRREGEAQTDIPDPPGISYGGMVNEALALQMAADSARWLAGEKRKALSLTTSPDKQQALKQEILELENRAYRLQNEADEKYGTLAQKRELKPDEVSAEHPEIRSSTLAGHTNFAGEMEIEPGRMMGRQLNDESYFRDHLGDLFTERDNLVLEDLIQKNSDAIQTMQKASEIQKEIDREKMRVSGAKNSRENRRALNRITLLEEQALMMKYEAVKKYQVVNDGVYALFEEEILTLDNPGIDEARKSAAGHYRKQAVQSYEKASELRGLAGDLSGTGKKYDKLAEANAYELVALENQKRAYAVLAGILSPEQIYARPQTVVSTGDEQVTTGDIAGVKEQPDRVRTGTAEQKAGEGEDPVKGNRNAGIPVKEISPGVTAADELYQVADEEFGLERFASQPYSSRDPIPQDRILPAGLSYRIQVGVFRNKVTQDYFGGLFPIFAESDLEKGFIRYYAGLFRTFSTAEQALPEVRNAGFSDAFVVAHLQGRNISIERARELEKNLPSGNLTTQQMSSRDLEQPVYRIILGFFDESLTGTRLDYYQKLAGTHKVQFLKNKKGQYIYTIGNFLTFEEAETSRTALASKGLSGLTIQHFMGNQRLPAGTAR